MTDGAIVGKAFKKGVGICYVSSTPSKDFFTLKAVASGREFHTHRSSINWRK